MFSIDLYKIKLKLDRASLDYDFATPASKLGSSHFLVTALELAVVKPAKATQLKALDPLCSQNRKESGLSSHPSTVQNQLILQARELRQARFVSNSGNFA